MVQLVEYLSTIHKPWDPAPRCHKPGVMVQVCKLSTQEVEAGGSEVQGILG